MHSQSDSPSLPSPTRELTERLRPFEVLMVWHCIASPTFQWIHEHLLLLLLLAPERLLACFFSRHHP
jgi:hypothetical protein